MLERHSSWAVWLTGLPGSGKSVISRALLKRIRKLGEDAEIVSIDALRRIATPNPRYTEEERSIVYGALVYASTLLVRNGVNVIIDATGNRRAFRDKARREIPRFVEVYVRCPLEVCIYREKSRGKETFLAPKGIYDKAARGESATVPGIGVPYEEPLSPEVIVDSDKLTPEECADKVIEELKRLRYL